MGPDRLNYIKNALRVFSFATIQDLAAAILLMRYFSIQPQEILDWVEQSKKEVDEFNRDHPVKDITPCHEKAQDDLIICPSCNHKTAKAFKVNTKPCNQVGGSYTQQIVCKNCEYEEFE